MCADRPVVLRYAVLRIGEGWFDAQPPTRGVDVRRWRMWPHVAKPDNGWTPFDTLRIDLGRPEDDLFAALNSTTRNEIRRAERQDSLEVDVTLRPGVAQVRELLDFFDQAGPQP